MDGFTIRRTGDSPTKMRVLLYLEHFPEQYKVLPELGSILGIKEDSRIGVIQALWNYIKLQGLQDKVDRKLIRADDKLRMVRAHFQPKSRYLPSRPVVWRGQLPLPTAARSR
jgi:SWI/SNF-related matrix-associated actin-dependent regulator of chromatin subfamily D